MKSAFIPFDERLAIIDDVIKPGYAALLAGPRRRQPAAGPGPAPACFTCPRLRLPVPSAPGGRPAATGRAGRRRAASRSAVPTAPVGDHRRQHHLGVAAGRRGRRDVAQHLGLQVGADRGAGVRG